MKSWLRDFILPVCADSKFPSSGEKRCSCNCKADDTRGRPKTLIDQYLCSVSLTRSSRSKLIYTRVEPIIDLLLPKEQTGLRRGKLTGDQLVLHKGLSRLGIRPVSYLSIRQQHMTLSVTVALPAS